MSMLTTLRRALPLSVLASLSLALAGCGGVVVEPAPEPQKPAPEPEVAPPTGALVWSRVYGGAFDDSAGSLARAPGDHVRFTGRGPLDGATDPAETRGLLMDVDGDGEIAVHHRFGVSTYYPVKLAAVGVGAAGETIVAGYFDKTNDIGGCSLVGGPGGGEVVAALDSEGSCLWATTFIGLSFSSFDVGPTGEIVFAGHGPPGASLGNGLTLPKPPAGGSNFFARLSSTGEPVGVGDATGGAEAYGEPLVRFDGDGVIVAIASSVTRYDAQGAKSWSRSTADAGRINGLTVAGGNIVVAAQTEATASLRAFHGHDGSDAWQTALASTSELGAVSFGVSEGSDLALVARFAGDAKLGDAELAGGSQDNLVWALLDGAGGVIRSKVVPFAGTVSSGNIATSADGSVWILGEFTGSVDFGDGLHTAHPPPAPMMSALDPAGYDVFLVRYR